MPLRENYNGKLRCSMVKNPPANAGDAGDEGSIPGSGRSPGAGNGNLLQYSCLENSMDSGAWWATVHGVGKPWTQLRHIRITGTKFQCLFYLIYEDMICLLRTYTALNTHTLSLTLSHTHIRFFYGKIIILIHYKQT